MRGYLAFPPPSTTTTTSTRLSKELTEPIETCVTVWRNQRRPATDVDTQAAQSRPGNGHTGYTGNITKGDTEKRKRHEEELGERSEIEWVRAGGVLRDAFGRRDWTRTGQIQQELRVQDMEEAQMARWVAYEARWRSLHLDPRPSITFMEFPWPLKEPPRSRNISTFTCRAVSDFLFESLAVRANLVTKRERIRSALLRWHPDKISSVLYLVVQDDLGLVREGIHVVFGILKELQEGERTGVVM